MALLDAAPRPAWSSPPRRLAPAAVAGLGVAVPGGRGQAELWEEFFAEHYGHAKKARALWLRSGVRYRHGVADPRVMDVRAWSTQRRMEAFAELAPPLGRAAIEACLADAGLAAADVGQLTVVTCTGYGTPGLDVLLARDLGLDPAAQRLHIGHMGCYAAIPGLATTADAAAARGKVAVMLCLELPSLHIQPPTADVEQLVAHALFADAAVAVAVLPDAPGYEVLDVAARTSVQDAPLMRWDVTDTGFRMALSTKVPLVLERHVAPLVDELLRRHGLAVPDVAGWAVHPGGPAILDVAAARLGLPADALAVSRGVLADYGNCSSATVLLVLDRLRRARPPAEDDPVVMLAFGPGLTLYGALLRATGGR
jgi:predicted naringenin-chalcone synthase